MNRNLRFYKNLLIGSEVPWKVPISILNKDNFPPPQMSRPTLGPIQPPVQCVARFD